jgi:hypothetical protein
VQILLTLPASCDEKRGHGCGPFESGKEDADQHGEENEWSSGHPQVLDYAANMQKFWPVERNGGTKSAPEESMRLNINDAMVVVLSRKLMLDGDASWRRSVS